MNARERYYWDLTGYLVLRDVFPQEDVKAANEAIEYLGEVVQSGDEGPEVALLRERTRPSIEDGILTRTTNGYPFFVDFASAALRAVSQDDCAPGDCVAAKCDVRYWFSAGSRSPVYRWD